ncbi:gliding motility-associated C-terminal domain-containing protein [Maribellus sediminis]|uniref:T9SS type B sorting domain-containing protein n=1 Tax=Maribellus sediminis TaxID=2696285 RepID=UPI001430C731|nr:gliding motility-associated C-terminal domain-containing protein [Maribellus sediminis]
MIKLKHILTIILLAVTALVANGQSYVIDSVCEGAERTYRRDGEAGYTYDWFILDMDSNVVATPVGADVLVDTTWGSEIDYQWLDTGIFSIKVEVFSEHLCDTLELGQVIVYPDPGLIVPDDQMICAMEDIVVSGDSAWNYSVLFWETRGDGSFSNADQLHPTYYLGPTDSVSGSVTLVLTAWGLADNETCIPVVDSITYFFSNPEIDLTVYNVLCYGDSTASIAAAISNGIAPYTYSWTGPDGFTASTDSISGLKAGEYILTVSDANGCPATDTAWIEEPEELLLSIDSVHDVSCFGYSDGWVTASAIGGTPPYNFDLSGISASGDSVRFDGLSAGKYELTLTDANGCEVSDSLEITEPDELLAIIDTVNNVQCYEFDNGSAHVAVIGGTGPFTYEWSTLPIQDSAWAVDLEPGTYSVIVTDINGCEAYDTVIITEPEPLVLSADSLDVRCGGKKPGAIDLHVSGGTPFANAPYYLFEWQDTTGTILATTEDLDSIGGGLYTVWVTDSLGCVAMHQVFINDIKNLVLEASVDSAYCYGDLWNIDITATKGKKPYEYVWTDSTGVNVISMDEDLIGISSGIYIVTVYDSDSCNETMYFNLEEPEEILADLYPDDTLICETEITRIQADPDGGTGAYIHEWTGSGAAYLDRTDTTVVYFGPAPAGTYQMVYTVTDENNCSVSDSVEIEVLPTLTGEEYREVCENSPEFTWNSHTILTTLDSSYVDTLVSVVTGCDSIATLNVTILPTVYGSESMSICENSPEFGWNSHTVLTTLDSSYIDTLVSAQGCDSIATLNISIIPTEYGSETREVCENSPEFIWYSHTVSTIIDSSYIDTLATVDGCDSIVTLSVTILPTVTGSESIEICENSLEFNWNSHTVSTIIDSSYVDTLVSVLGCDSIATLYVNIIPTVYGSDSIAICESSGDFAWGTHTISSKVDSSYVDTLISSANCDSVATLYVSILPVTDSTIDTMICEGSPAYTWNGVNIVSTNDSTYQTTLTNHYGCDSLLTYNVTILPAVTTTFDTTLCEGSPTYAWESHTIQTYSDSVYIETLATIDGCDSVVSYTVTITPKVYGTETAQICENSPEFVWNTHTILTTVDSSYTDTLVSVNGCDSIATLNVTIIPTLFATEIREVCENSATFTWNSHTILTTVDSSYVDTLATVDGCDSVVTLSVIILPTVSGIESMAVCENSATFDWNGQTISTTIDSSYVETLVSAAGCDSIATLFVSIILTVYGSDSMAVCENSGDFAWGIHTVSSLVDSIYIDTLVSTANCDSIATLKVTILPVTNSTQDTAICEGTPAYTWNGMNIVSTNDSTYQTTLTNQYGCDSLLTYNVTILPAVTTTIDTTLCEGSPTYAWESHTIQTNTDSTYYETLGNANGCDSMVIYNVTIIPIVYGVEAQEVCENSPQFDWNGQTVLTTVDSMYVDTLISASGCDSIATLNVSILPTLFNTEFREVCENSATFTWNSHTILTTVDSSYLDTLATVDGCDSVVTLSVSILPTVSGIESMAVCENSETFDWNGQTVSTTVDSSYVETLVSSGGCDSIATLNVTIIPTVYGSDSMAICENSGDFAWNSHTVSSTVDSSYIDTLFSAANCDSIVTLTVTILPVSNSTQDTAICEGTPTYTWNGVNIVSTNDSTYLTMLTNQYGCDSLLTYNVTILPAVTTTYDTTLCEGSPTYAWEGHTIQTNTDSTYYKTLGNANGCDSMIIYNVTILPIVYSIESQEVCENSPVFDWNGQTVLTTVDSMYVDTLISASGCDSIATLNVSILPTLFNTEFREVCENSATFTWNSHTILTTVDSSYVDTLATVDGCDSVVTLSVSILPTVSGIESMAVCENSATFDWNGQTVSTIVDSSYVETLISAAGCDSIATLFVTIVPTVYGSDSMAVCENSGDFAWGTHTVSSAVDSIYIDTLISATNCDSVVTLKVTILPVTNSTQDTAICEGTPAFTWNGVNIVSTNDSTYQTTLTNQYGCDSLLTYIVTILPAVTTTIDTTLCEGSPNYAWESHTIQTTADSTYIETLATVNGCDSTIIYNVTILPIRFSIESQEICENSPVFTWNGHTVLTTVDSSYVDTLISTVTGCDSIATLNVTILPTLYSKESTAVCENSATFVWNSHTISTTVDSSYVDTLSTVNGCDSIVTLSVSILPTVYGSEPMTVCENSDEFSWNGYTVSTTADSSYTATLVSASGCDSVATLYVSIVPTVYGNDSMAICENSGDIAWGIHTVSSAVDSVYIDTLISAANCDSVVTLKVTILPVTNSSQDTAICEGTPAFTWNGVSIVSTNDSLYETTLTNQYGCDSLLTLNVIVLPVAATTFDTTLCEGSPTFVWESHTIQTSTDSSYIETLATVDGCDSVVTYNVTIIPIEYTVVDTALCEGSPTYTWESHTIQTNTDSSYIETLATVDGCDSIVTYNVTIIPLEYTVVDTTLCEGSPTYTWESHTIQTNTDSTYYETLATVDGCDSLVTYNVSIVPTVSTVVDTTLCEGTPIYVWESHTIQTNIDSTYLETLSTINGCDSVVTYNVHILPVAATVVDTSLCEGSAAYTWESHTIQANIDSTYLETLATSDGCDSVVTYNVTIIPVSNSVTDTAVCLDEPVFVWNGQNISTSADSIYTASFTNAGGCDSVATLNVTILLPAITSIDTSLCIGSPTFTWNGQTIQTDSDSTYVTLTSAYNGCDSTIILDVTILPETSSITDTAVCYDPSTFDWNGITVSREVDSTYQTTLENSYGCDSLLTLNVKVFEITYSTLDTTILEAQAPFEWGSNFYDTPGTYYDTLTNAAGCDSIMTLNLEILYGTTSDSHDSICETEAPYIWNGQSYDTTGTYYVVLENAAGGDSTAYLHLTVWETTYGTLDTAICEPDLPFVYLGKTYGTAGVYTDTLNGANANGCDSILTITLETWPTEETILTEEVCDSDLPYIWNTQTLTGSGTYYDTLSTAHGCDSVLILTLNVKVGGVTNIIEYACEEFTWSQGDGKTYTESGTYEYIDTVNAECQDTLRMTLVLSKNFDINLVAQDISCYGNNDGLIVLNIYQGIPPYTISWSNGANTEKLTDLSEGTYSVTVKDSIGCEVSGSVYIAEPDPITITIDQVTNVSSWNAGDGSIEVSVDGGTEPYASFEWTDEAGNIVGTDEDLFDQPGGVYTLEVTDANNCTDTISARIIEPVPPTPYMICLRDFEFTCFEELAAYPVATSLQEYLDQLRITGGVYSNCGLDLSTFTFRDSIIDAENTEYCHEEYRIYSITDSCGETLESCIQRIIVNDNDAPFISCPDPIELVNASVPPAYTLEEFIAAGGDTLDNCRIVSFRMSNEVYSGTADKQIITRTYEVKDYCGNVSTCDHVITIDNTNDLVITCPPGDETCPEGVIDPPYASLDAFLAAGGDTASHFSPIVPDSWMHVKDTTDGETCPETITRIYAISNEAGQTATCEQYFVRTDNENPTLSLPRLTLQGCPDDEPLPYTSVAQMLAENKRSSAGDNCGIVDFKEVREQQVIQESCPRIIKRFYQVWDACGNTSGVREEIIEIRPRPLLVADTLPDLTVDDCVAPARYANYSEYFRAGGNVVDFCGPVTLEYRGDLPHPTDPAAILRTYRLHGECSSVDDVQKINLNVDVPVFDPIGPLCQYSPAPALPDTSINGIKGIWKLNGSGSNVAVVNTDVADTLTYIFIPDAGQCAAMTSLTVVVTPAVELSENAVTHVGYSHDAIGSIDLNILGGTAPFNISWTGPDGFTATTRAISGLYAGDYTVVVTDDFGCSATITIPVLANQPAFNCPPDTTFECPDPSVYPPFTSVAEFIAGGGNIDPLDAVTDFGWTENTVTSAYCLTIERRYFYADSYGNTDTCVQRIDFYDNVPPVVNAPDGGTAECLSSLIPNISTLTEFIAAGGTVYDPNCTLDSASFTVNKRIVQTQNSSEVTYIFSILDLCGNPGVDSSVFTLTDTIPPEAVCNSITVHLDSLGNYILTEIDMAVISAGSNDNCTAFEDLTIEVSPAEFTCEDVESGKQVHVVVTDEAGNVGECWANIIVVDELPPVALCQDITVSLDDNGEAFITTAMIDAGSYDNCKLESVQISRDRFDCTDLGANIVQLIATDAYGNTDTCEATVTVLDTISPLVSCIERDTIQLSEEDGTYVLTWEMLTTSEWDNCEIVSRTLSKDTLDCRDIGTTYITATVIDQSGNVGECTAEFVVFGNIAPVAEPDYDTTIIDVPISVYVVENDYDIGLKTDIRNSTLTIMTQPGSNIGTAEADTVNGFIKFTPAPGYIGQAVVKYRICDDAIPCEEMCDTTYLYITVLPANKPPLAVDDYFDVPCISLSGDVSFNDYDPDGDAIAVNPVPLVPPVNGTLVLYSDGHFEYEPFIDFTEGVDSFQYEIWDKPTFGESLRDTAWVYITRVPDNDCDGVADAIDIDDDNDGIRDNIENGGFWPEDPDAELIDSDNDGIPNYLDIDSDNDGIVDNIEGQWENGDGWANWNEPVGWRDQNNNGWDAHYDWEEGAGGIPFDMDLADTDGDGVPDYLDSDSDNDNVPDYIEGHDDNANGIADVIRIYSDVDRDGLDDAYDWVDGWGIPDLIDNETGSSAPLQDFDGDGTRDWRDTNDEDDEYMTINEDINGNGDYSDDDLDLDGHPEYLDTELECDLFIPEGFSPNDDGVHDFFQILCIYPRYPDAKLMIFNRNGNLLWEKEHYGNYDYWGWNDAWWWGTSDNKLTIGRSGGLPAGNYIYVLLLNDGLGGVRNGTVMIAY